MTRIAIDEDTAPRYSFDHLYSALCIWEEICDPQLDGRPWEDMLTHHGYGDMRTLVIEHLAVPCDVAWGMANEALDKAFVEYNEKRDKAWKAWCLAKGIYGTTFPAMHASFDEFRQEFEQVLPYPDDLGSFDWEFVPFWLRTCVDWSDLDKPRVRGAKPEEGSTNNQ